MTDDHKAAEATRDSIEKLSQAYRTIRGQMAQVIVGQSDVIDQLLLCLMGYTR